jgi:hypothetical protein
MNSVSSPQTLALPLNLTEVDNKPVLVDFDGGQISSDGGLLLLREVEQQIGIIKSLTEVIHDARDARYVKHTIMDLMMQRVSQIAAGYEDADDCDDLRADPIIKMCAGRSPNSDDDLASQPTMSRFENSITRTYLYRLAQVFVDNFMASYDNEPKIIVLDFDDTEDEVHGDQQLALFNKYFDEYCFMPLHVYEGLSGKLITTILKPGKRANGKTMLAIVKRLISYIRSLWPNTIIIFRGDSHFSYPEVMEWIDGQDNVYFNTGLTANSRLEAQVQSHIERAKKLYNLHNNKVSRYHSFYYQADSWNHYRRVIAKIEILEDGLLNVRYIVTNMEQAKAKTLYCDIYCARGNAELYIKDHKLYLKSDRTSCHRFAANQFRLLLHSAAYVLIHALKTNILKHTQWVNATIATIRLRLLKIGARVRQLKTRIKMELPSCYPLKETLTNSFQIFEILRQVT